MNHNKNGLTILLTFLLAISCYGQSEITETEPRRISNGNSEYIEIPRKFLNKPLLLINRITGYPDKLFYYGSAGMYVNYTSILRLEIYNKNQIRVVQQQYQNSVLNDDIIRSSVLKNHLDPTLAFIPIEQSSRDFIQIKAEFFKKDLKIFSVLEESTIDKYKLKPLNGESILINKFEINKNSIQVSRALNFVAEKSPKKHFSDYLSIEHLLTLRILPEDLMQTRKWNPRIGNFHSSIKKYDSNNVLINKTVFVEKWRLEPQDTAAYFSGRLSYPKKPIIFYMGENVPNKWKKYLKAGVLNWLPIFEKIGFKNAIEVREKPDNAQWDDNDPNYNVIRWVASEIQDAQGNIVTDPRTGEILNGMLIWYQNYFSYINNEYFVMTAAANPAARTPILADSIFGEIMKEIISHEMGHALGLGHNMIASSSYPTDSLRSRSFLETHSLTASIMDYASFNYVAQVEDMPLPLIRSFGPYDYWAIEFAYKINSALVSDEREVTLTNTLINERLQNDLLNFREQEYSVVDPTNLTGDLGHDPILSGEYGLNNLRQIMPHIVEWSIPENGDTKILFERFALLIEQANNIFRNVIVQIGGRKTRNTGSGYTTEMTDSKVNLAAMEFLSKNVFNSIGWLYNKQLETLSNNDLYAKNLKKLQTNALKTLLNKERLLRLIDCDIKNNTSNTTIIIRMLSDIILKNSDCENIPLAVQKVYVNTIEELIRKTTNELVLKHALKSELEYMQKIATSKIQRESNPLIRGFYIELFE